MINRYSIQKILFLTPFFEEGKKSKQIKLYERSISFFNSDTDMELFRYLPSYLTVPYSLRMVCSKQALCTIDQPHSFKLAELVGKVLGLYFSVQALDSANFFVKMKGGVSLAILAARDCTLCGQLEQ